MKCEVEDSMCGDVQEAVRDVEDIQWKIQMVLVMCVNVEYCVEQSKMGVRVLEVSILREQAGWEV